MSYAEDHGLDGYEYEDFLEDTVRLDEWIRNKQQRSLENLLAEVEDERKTKKLKKKIKKLKKKVKKLNIEMPMPVSYGFEVVRRMLQATDTGWNNPRVEGCR